MSADTTRTIQGRRVYPEWMAAVQASPEQATATRHAVLAVLEERRHGASHIQSCFDDSDVVGIIEIRFAVATRSTADRATIADARFVEVEEGPPIAEATARCLEDALSGNLTVQAGPGESFLESFDGRIDYLARFHIPSE